MAGPLDGIRVLDLTWVLSGPFATMVLSDLGAEVIKVERPHAGDMARGNGPFIDGESSYFLSLNRGKKSLTLDLGQPRGKEVFLRLVQKADVVVENFTPGTMKGLGLDYEALRQHNPALIYAAVSGFGQTGPYASRPALDIVVQAMGGIMSITGEPGGPPLRPGASLGDIAAGLFTAVGILAALQERGKSGLGQMLDISMLDCQVAILENAFARYLATGEVPGPLGTRHPVFTPFQAFETKDGWVVVALVGGLQDRWPLFCASIGRVDLIDDPRFESGWSRTQHYQELEPIFSQALKARTTQEWLEEFSRVGIPCGPVNTIDQVANDPQVRAREMLTSVLHPRLGEVKVVNTPVKLSRTPAKLERASPALGEHTREVLGQLLGLGPQELDDLAQSGVL
ncbi:MAG: CaiB/BaiF CoA-transferase family protein [Chloroflexota bacterium]|nr:CaiB/BaiF CoA-transferase family protein [Chloroflexota bacterium]